MNESKVKRLPKSISGGPDSQGASSLSSLHSGFLPFCSSSCVHFKMGGERCIGCWEDRHPSSPCTSLQKNVAGPQPQVQIHLSIYLPTQRPIHNFLQPIILEGLDASIRYLFIYYSSSQIIVCVCFSHSVMSNSL